MLAVTLNAGFMERLRSNWGVRSFNTVSTEHERDQSCEHSPRDVLLIQPTLATASRQDAVGPDAITDANTASLKKWSGTVFDVSG
jgi:hypothetical protein